jgi:hypothetical protein
MALSRLRRLAAVALGALALTGCASMDVRSFVERGADVTQYRTYNWGPADAQATGDPRLDNNPFFYERIQAGVEKQLRARGFEKTSAGTPDLLIHYHASVTQQINANGADQPYVSCDDCKAYVFDAGTILVDLVDARTHQLVWRGWAEGSIDGVIDDQAWMEKRIDEAVARILERLPRRL